MASIDFDPADYIDEIDTNELRAELGKRNVHLANALDLDEASERIEACLQKGCAAEAFALLAEIHAALDERDLSERSKRYKAALLNRDPITKRPVIS